MSKAVQPRSHERQYPEAVMYETTIQKIRRQREEQKAEELHQAKLERQESMRYILKAFGYLGLVVGGLANIYLLYVVLWFFAG